MNELQHRPGTFPLPLALRLFEDSCKERNLDWRYRVRPEATAHHGEVASVRLPDDGSRAELEIAYFGLYGLGGVLPGPYTRMVLEAEHTSRDEISPLRDFLDLFNSRLISLLGLVYAVTRPEYREAPGWIDPKADRADWARDFLAEWSGLTRGDLTGAGFDWNLGARYAGAFALFSRPAAALEVVLSDKFAVPVQVISFPPGWDADPRGPSIRLVVGPLGWEAFRNLYPEGEPLPRMLRLARLFVGAGPRFEVELVLAAAEIPPLELGGEADDPDSQLLDWDAWLEPTPDGPDGRLLIDTDQCAECEQRPVSQLAKE